jgi:hypothetical protein
MQTQEITGNIRMDLMIGDYHILGIPDQETIRDGFHPIPIDRIQKVVGHVLLVID